MVTRYAASLSRYSIVQVIDGHVHLAAIRHFVGVRNTLIIYWATIHITDCAEHATEMLNPKEGNALRRFPDLAHDAQLRTFIAVRKYT